ILRFVAEHLELGVLAADVQRLLRKLEGERRVLARAHDLEQLVGGNQRVTFLLDVHLLNGDAQRDLRVRRRDGDPTALRRKEHALVDRRGGARGHHSVAQIEGFQERGSVADDLHGVWSCLWWCVMRVRPTVYWTGPISRRPRRSADERGRTALRR